MFKKLGVWGVSAVALVGAIGFAKTSIELQNVREAARVDALTDTARQELQQALGDRDLAREQADDAMRQAVELRRETEELEKTFAQRKSEADAEIAAIGESMAMLELERPELERVLDQLRSHHAALTLELEEATARRDNLRAEEASLVSALAEKREETEQGRIVRQNAEAMLEKAGAEREAAREEVRQAGLQVAALQRESEELEALIGERRQEEDAQLEAIEQRVAALDAQRSQLEQVIEGLRIDRASLTRELQKATERHDALVAENDNLAAALVARASERDIRPEYTISDARPEVLRQSEEDPVGNSVNVDWAALGAIPLPPRRPEALGLMEKPPTEEKAAPVQVRRPAAVTASARAEPNRGRAAPRMEPTRSVGGAAQIPPREPATLALPSSLLPETPAIGVR